MKTNLLPALAGASILALSSALAQVAPPPPAPPAPPPPPASTPGEGDQKPERRNRVFFTERKGERTGPDAQVERREIFEGQRVSNRREPRVFLGVVTAPVPQVLAAQLGLTEGFGLVVQEVMPESPAAKAGVQKYDILKLMNDQQLLQESQLSALLAANGKDKEVTLTVIRKGQEQKLTVRPEERELPVRTAEQDYVPVDPFDGGVREVQERARRELEKAQRQVEEIRRSAEDKARALQDEIRKNSLGGRTGADIAPELLLEDAKGAHSGPIEVQSATGTTTIDGAKAHFRMKDQSGEIEVAAENGKRMLTARDKDGKVVFSGPIDTPDQRNAVPEQFRKKLEQIKIHQNGNSISIDNRSGGGEVSVSTSSESNAEFR